MNNLNMKKSYTKPTITKIGDISNLTLGANNRNACDGLGTVGSGNNPARCTS